VTTAAATPISNDPQLAAPSVRCSGARSRRSHDHRSATARSKPAPHLPRRRHGPTADLALCPHPRSSAGLPAPGRMPNVPRTDPAANSIVARKCAVAPPPTVDIPVIQPASIGIRVGGQSGLVAHQALLAETGCRTVHNAAVSVIMVYHDRDPANTDHRSPGFLKFLVIRAVARVALMSEDCTVAIAISPKFRLSERRTHPRRRATWRARSTERRQRGQPETVQNRRP
jgi:hypothetical protein